MSRCILCNSCPEIDHDIPVWAVNSQMKWDDSRSGYICHTCMKHQAIATYEDVINDGYSLDLDFDLEGPSILEERILDETQEDLE